jgi:hypothetical protein
MGVEVKSMNDKPIAWVCRNCGTEMLRVKSIMDIDTHYIVCSGCQMYQHFNINDVFVDEDWARAQLAQFAMELPETTKQRRVPVQTQRSNILRAIWGSIKSKFTGETK